MGKFDSTIMVFLVIAVALAGCIWFLVPDPVGCSYRSSSAVCGRDNVPAAISNAVHEIESRGFILTELYIKKQPLKDKFYVHAGGITSNYLR